MEIKANDDGLVEALVLQVTALRAALTAVISSSPQLQGKVLALANNLPGAMLATELSDLQIEALAELLRALAAG